MIQAPTCFHVFADAEQVAHAAVRWLCAEAEEAIVGRGVFKCVLAGGTTPARIYQLLAEAAAAGPGWQLYLGDERCLPVEHPERNSRLVERSGLLGRGAQLHPLPAELGAVAAAARYETVVVAALPFDFVLLGLGEDGHTASLFPGHAWPEAAAVCAVQQAPKPPSERVSLTPWALRQARQVLFLATGAAKAAAVAAWYRGAPLPAAHIAPTDGVDVFVDAAAWAALEPLSPCRVPVYCRGERDV